MKTKTRRPWKDAFMASPGPASKRQVLLLSLKGACMGAADTVPGVSGGTIALITGIYEQLLAAIRSFDSKVISLLLRRDLKKAVAHLHIRFLLSLFIGIGISVISLARIMSRLLEYYPVPAWSLFFGLIAASVWSVGRKVDFWTIQTGLMFIAGTACAFVLVGMVPATTPETFVFIFFSGMIAICAMILPGLSGAFILLILGKYEFIVATLKNPFLPHNMIVILVFAAGCAVGLAGFSRVLKFFLERFRPVTMAFLAGMVLGSLRRIWPWKKTLIEDTINGKTVVLQEKNILPELAAELVLPVGLMCAGMAAVLLLEWIASSKKKP